jgi:hypothetical protein
MILVPFARQTKFIALVLIVACIDIGCAPISNINIFGSRSKTYRYVYEMTEPVMSKDLLYRAPKFNILFQIDQGAIEYSLKNTSGSKITLLSGNASLGINGKFSPVRTSASYYTDTNSYLLTQAILPGGYVQDFFIPRSNVYYDGNKWIEKVLFPNKDNNNPVIRQSIQKKIGSEVALILAMKTGTELTEYTFKFRVANVKVVHPDSIPYRASRIPAPPSPGHPMTTMELWSAIGIVSSVVLFSVFLVTRTKPFPGGL